MLSQKRKFRSNPNRWEVIKRAKSAALSAAPITSGIPDQQRRMQTSQKTTTFKTCRTVVKAQAINSVGSEYNVGYFFTLADVPGYTEYTALYDQYRITKIEVNIMPCNTACNNGQYCTPSWMLSSVDYDNATSQTTAQLREVDDVQIIHVQRGKKITFQPRCAIVTAQSSLSGLAEAKPGLWINCSTTGVQHYGLKLAMPSANSNGIATMDVMCRYFLEFKKSL